jgi:hypothetical protein
VSWVKSKRKWGGYIMHNRKRRNLGSFDDERKAAQAFDKEARRLRCADAHGGRSGTQWHRVNFPTKRELARAKARHMPAC